MISLKRRKKIWLWQTSFGFLCRSHFYLNGKLRYEFLYWVWTRQATEKYAKGLKRRNSCWDIWRLRKWIITPQASAQIKTVYKQRIVITRDVTHDWTLVSLAVNIFCFLAWFGDRDEIATRAWSLEPAWMRESKGNIWRMLSQSFSWVLIIRC